MLLKSLTLLLVTLLFAIRTSADELGTTPSPAAITPPPVIEASRASAESDKPNARKPALVLAKLADPLASQKCIREHAERAFALIDSWEEFECRLSRDCVGETSKRPVVLNTAFQGVFQGMPVYGQVKIKGQAELVLIPDARRAAFELRLTGQAQLDGIAESGDVKIRTETTADFSATKRIFLDHSGFSTLPATGIAQATIKTRGITSNRPILGKLSVRVAQVRTTDSLDEAETETAEQLAAELIRQLDDELDQISLVANESLAQRTAASLAARERWQRMHFATQADGIHLGRSAAGSSPTATLAEPTRFPAAPILLRLPRARFEMNTLLSTMRFLGRPDDVSRPISAVAAQPVARFRPKVMIDGDSIFVALEFDPPSRTAELHLVPVGPLPMSIHLPTVAQAK